MTTPWWIEGALPTDAEVRQHQWWIDPREYARHEARRGRRFAFVNLVPARTALVVIDMVPFFVSGNPYCRGIVPNIGAIADSLRAAGGTVAWILPAVGEQTSVLDEFFGPETAEAYRTSGGTGPLPERLWPELAVCPDDVLVEKSAHSAFFPGRCTLPGLLEERGVDTVLISGTVTNVCCESSARDAATLGLRVILVADANAARRDQDHNATLHTIYRSFGDVRPTSDLIKMIQAPTRREPLFVIDETPKERATPNARFFFDAGSGTVLWIAGPEGRDVWGYAVDLEGLPISRLLRDELVALVAQYDTSLNWDYPPDPGPWREAQCQEFNGAARRVLGRLRGELGSDWLIHDEFQELHEDPDLDRYLADPAGFVRGGP